MKMIAIITTVLLVAAAFTLVLATDAKTSNASLGGDAGGSPEVPSLALSEPQTIYGGDPVGDPSKEPEF